MNYEAKLNFPSYKIEKRVNSYCNEIFLGFLCRWDAQFFLSFDWMWVLNQVSFAWSVYSRVLDAIYYPFFLLSLCPSFTLFHVKRHIMCCIYLAMAFNWSLPNGWFLCVLNKISMDQFAAVDLFLSFSSSFVCLWWWWFSLNLFI